VGIVAVPRRGEIGRKLMRVAAPGGAAGAGGAGGASHLQMHGMAVAWLLAEPEEVILTSEPMHLEPVSSWQQLNKPAIHAS